MYWNADKMAASWWLRFLARLGMGKTYLFHYVPISIGDDLYMRRWFLVACDWFGLYLQNAKRSDADRDLHDHPWPFAALILHGGYWEWRKAPDGIANRVSRAMAVVALTRPGFEAVRTHVGVFYGPGSVLFRGASFAHRLELKESTRAAGGSWSLILRGAKGRRWGFQTPEGWVDENEYRARPANGNPGRATAPGPTEAS